MQYNEIIDAITALSKVLDNVHSVTAETRKMANEKLQGLISMLPSPPKK